MEGFRASPNQSSEKRGLIDQGALNAFANFLTQARFALPENVTTTEIRKMVGLEGNATVINWEEGDTLPEYENLGRIAVAYKIEGEKYYDFLKAYEISKKAREAKNNARKHKSGKTFLPTYEGGSSGRRGPRRG